MIKLNNYTIYCSQKIIIKQFQLKMLIINKIYQNMKSY
jgi:hypothetical protein